MKESWVYRRGDLYLANLGVPVGSKQGGVRPVVVLQNDVGNLYAPTITVAPLTSKGEKKKRQPTIARCTHWAHPKESNPTYRKPRVSGIRNRHR